MLLIFIENKLHDDTLWALVSLQAGPICMHTPLNIVTNRDGKHAVLGRRVGDGEADVEAPSLLLLHGTGPLLVQANLFPVGPSAPARRHNAQCF